MRFDKLIADTLGKTRSEARALIKKGVCAADGEIIRDIARAVTGEEKITVEGVEYSYEKFIYIMMNKPAGVVSATEDKRIPTVLSLLPEKFKRYSLFPVVRIDRDAEGFLHITKDGQAADNLLAPAKKVPKDYFVRLEKTLSEEDIARLEGGVDIGGYVTKPAKVTRSDGNEAVIRIVEGKFHQVKKMFETVGNRVLYLKRISFASLPLDPNLKSGEYRFLTEEEKTAITSPALSL